MYMYKFSLVTFIKFMDYFGYETSITLEIHLISYVYSYSSNLYIVIQVVHGKIGMDATLKVGAAAVTH